MKKKNLIVTGILWGAAIVASALVHAPTVLSGCLLPSLAVCSLLVMASESTERDCQKESTR